MKRRNATIGSISHGTMRPEDLIPDFAYELRRLAKRGTGHRKLAQDAERALARYSAADITYDKRPRSADTAGFHGHNVPTGEDLMEFVANLSDALDSYARPYFHFGSHPGNGSDYGFWLSDNFNEDFDGLRVSNTSDIPAKYRGEVLHVNDHGNMTLYVQTSHGRRELWGVV